MCLILNIKCLRLFAFSAAFIGTICPARGRSVSVFPGFQNHWQDRAHLFLCCPRNITMQRHLQNCRTKVDPRAKGTRASIEMVKSWSFFGKFYLVLRSLKSWFCVKWTLLTVSRNLRLASTKTRNMRQSFQTVE